MSFISFTEKVSKSCDTLSQRTDSDVWKVTPLKSADLLMHTKIIGENMESTNEMNCLQKSQKHKMPDISTETKSDKILLDKEMSVLFEEEKCDQQVKDNTNQNEEAEEDDENDVVFSTLEASLTDVDSNNSLQAQGTLKLMKS